MFKNTILNLAYHHVQKPGDPAPLLPDLVCLFERFRWQLNYLRENSFAFLRCDELMQRVKAKQFLPPRVVTLSFDDGFYATAMNVAGELRSKEKEVATFFIVDDLWRGKPIALTTYIKLRKVLGEDASRILEYELLPKALIGSPYMHLLNPQVFDVEKTGYYQNESPDVRRLHTILFRMMPSDRSAEVIQEMAEGRIPKEIVREYLLSPDVFYLTGQGHEIAWHSKSHPFLGDASEELAEREIKPEDGYTAGGMKMVGFSDTFGWPFGGEFPARVKKVVDRYYESAWNYCIGEDAIPKLRAFEASPAAADPLDVPRIDQSQMEEYLGIPTLGE